MAAPLPFTERAGSARGATMGRPNGRLCYAAGGVHLRRVPLDVAGYDPGGAYWGRRPTGESLWCAWQGREAVYLDAPDRDAAKAALLAVAPALQFFQ